MRTCPNCRTGSMQPRTTTYANWHAGQYVTVPNMPAWSCDVCALCQIDPVALQRLLPLLGPVTRPDPAQARRAGDQQPLIGELAIEDADPDRDRRTT